MRLRSGRTISMTSNTAQNQTSSTQNVTSYETIVTQPMAGAETVTTTAGVTTPAVSEAVIPTTGPEVLNIPPHSQLFHNKWSTHQLHPCLERRHQQVQGLPLLHKSHFLLSQGSTL